jgi:hypothetical protein
VAQVCLGSFSFDYIGLVFFRDFVWKNKIHNFLSKWIACWSSKVLCAQCSEGFLKTDYVQLHCATEEVL